MTGTCTCGTINPDNPAKGLLAGATHRFDGKPCYLDISAPNALERIRAEGVGSVCGCQGRFRCSYHEGWHDALDRIEEELA